MKWLFFIVLPLAYSWLAQTSECTKTLIFRRTLTDDFIGLYNQARSYYSVHHANPRNIKQLAQAMNLAMAKELKKQGVQFRVDKKNHYLIIRPTRNDHWLNQEATKNHQRGILTLYHPRFLLEDMAGAIFYHGYWENDGGQLVRLSPTAIFLPHEIAFSGQEFPVQDFIARLAVQHESTHADFWVRANQGQDLIYLGTIHSTDEGKTISEIIARQAPRHLYRVKMSLEEFHTIPFDLQKIVYQLMMLNHSLRASPYDEAVRSQISELLIAQFVLELASLKFNSIQTLDLLFGDSTRPRLVTSLTQEALPNGMIAISTMINHVELSYTVPPILATIEKFNQRTSAIFNIAKAALDLCEKMTLVSNHIWGDFQSYRDITKSLTELEQLSQELILLTKISP